MELTSLAIEFHCSCCGAQGMGVMLVKDRLLLESIDFSPQDFEDYPLCPRCGSKVITLEHRLAGVSY